MISILISCLFDKLDNVKKMLQGKQVQVEYIIVVQGTNENILNDYKESNPWAKREDIKIIFDSNIGVTHSRNKAVKNANGQIALFCDDDITLANNCFELLHDSFESSPECDFLTFNVVDDGGLLLKAPLAKKNHTLRTILGVGTIQIAVRLNTETKQYQFPLNLGAGAKYPCCDEPVYLSKFLHDKKRGEHIHKTICSHPRESSGASLNSHVKVISRLIAFRYIFGGFWGVVVFVVFMLKNIKHLFKT